MDSATLNSESLSKVQFDQESSAVVSEALSNEISERLGDHPEQTPEPQSFRHARRCATAPAAAAAAVAALQRVQSPDARQSVFSEELVRRPPSTRTQLSRPSQNCLTKNETLNLLEAGLKSLGRATVTTVAPNSAAESSTSSDYSSPGDEAGDKVPDLVARVEEASYQLGAEYASEGVDQTFCRRLLRLLLQFGFSICLGSSVGLVTVIFHVATAKLEEYHRLGAEALADEMQSEVNHCAIASCGRLAFCIWMAAGTCVAALLVSWISQSIVPECIGGGTIATKICLAVGSPVPVRVGACRFVLSMLYVGAGNALGIEAPTLHISASVASMLHNAAAFICDRLSTRRCANSRDEPLEAPFFNKEGLPQAVVLGCAAGLSAAFRSPLAAISYAVEEYVDVRQTGTVTALVLLSSVSAALVCRIFDPFFGTGAMSISSSTATDAQGAAGSNQAEDRRSSMIAWLLTATSIGLLLGTLSPLVNSAVMRLRRFCHVERSLVYEVVFAGLAGLFTGVLGCGIYLITNCESAWGFGPSLGMVFDVRGVCHIPEDARATQEVWKILVLAFGKLVASGFCFATGGPGGVLMPSLFVGALLGRAVGHAAAHFDSALPHASAIFGMAALFSANMRLPLTAATVALEFATVDSTSYDARLVYTVPLAAALGTWMSAWWDPLSIHERSMFQDGINPFTLSQQIQMMVQSRAEEAVSRRNSMAAEFGPIGSCSSRTSFANTPSQGSILQTEPYHSHSVNGLSSHSPSISRMLGSVLPTRAAPKEMGTVNRSSMRMIVAAQRRSILFAYADPTRSSVCHASFISSPDEFLFASSAKKAKTTRFGSIFPSPPQVELLRKPTLLQATCNAPSNAQVDSSAVAATPSLRRTSPREVSQHSAAAQTSPRGSCLLEPTLFRPVSSREPPSRKESKESHCSSRRGNTGTPAYSLQSGNLLQPPSLDRPAWTSLDRNSHNSSSWCPSLKSNLSVCSPVNTASVGGDTIWTTASPSFVSDASSSGTGRHASRHTSCDSSVLSSGPEGFEGWPHPRLLGRGHLNQKQAQLEIPEHKPPRMTSFQRLRSMLWPNPSPPPGLDLYTLSDEDNADIAAEESSTSNGDTWPS